MRDAQAQRPFPVRWADVCIVLGVAWLARLIWILLLPNTHSVDVNFWVTVANDLRTGVNPYTTTTFLSWPPFWLVSVYCIDHVARALDVSFLNALRVLLIATESVLVFALFHLLSHFAPSATVRRVLLIGISLNPIAIILVCQHGNFDVFVGLFVVLGLLALLSYGRTGDILHWLAACFAIGLGIFAKTVPLALAPLLAPGTHAATRLGRWLGLTLFLGPAAVGLATLYVLGPHGVSVHVLHYRALAGLFGITGLLDLAGLHGASDRYQRGFALVALLVLAALFRALWRAGRLDGRQMILLAALILTAITAIGSGYSPQYAYWFLPLLVATYPLFDEGWRRVVLGFYVVAAATYLVEYALIPYYGSFMVALFPHSGWLRHWSAHSWFGKNQTWFDAKSRTLLDVPLFLAYLVLLFAGVRRVRLRPQRAEPAWARTGDAEPPVRY